MPVKRKRLRRRKNPEPDILVPDPEDRLVLITAARWAHVLEDHGRLVGRFNDLVRAIAQPDWISLRSGTHHPALAYYRQCPDMLLRVIVNFQPKNKFVLGTAYKAFGPDEAREEVIWTSSGSI